MNRLTNAEFRLRNAECGTRAPQSHSPTVPQSHNPTVPRPGISLTEVLISMGILAFGLLGVAAMLPVGGYYMMTGDEANRGAAVARAAFAEVVTRGMLNPDSWLMQPETGAPTPFVGQFRPLYLSQQRLVDLSTPRGQQRIVRTMGSVYVLDPLGVSRAIESNSALGSVSRFPAMVNQQVDFAADQAIAATWQPWQQSWPVRRLSISMPNPQRYPAYGSVPLGEPIPLSPDFASSVFTSSDELAVSMPDRGDDPSRQLWNAIYPPGNPQSNNPDPPDAIFNRATSADYSWLVTVVPSSSEARDALASDPSAFYYNVSVVVFHKRPFDFPTDGSASSSEKLLRGRIVSRSLSGGELILEAADGGNVTDAFSLVKPGLWIMLCGPSPSSSATSPVIFARWYRVLSVEGKQDDGERITRDFNLPTAPRRLVALRGPAWPWGLATQYSDNNALSNDLRVTIIPGAVAVHSRNMRLEGNTAWSVE